MSTHMPGVQSFFLAFLHHFVLGKLATSSMRVKWSLMMMMILPLFNNPRSVPDTRQTCSPKQQTLCSTELLKSQKATGFLENPL